MVTLFGEDLSFSLLLSLLYFLPPPSSPLSLSVFCRILIGYHLFTCKKLNLSNWIKYTNLSRTYDVFTCLPNARCLPSANTQYTNAFLLLFSLAWGSHSPWANDFKICLWVSALYIAMFVCLVYSKSLCNQTISNYVFLFIRWLCFVYVVNFDRFSRNSTIFWFAMNEYQVTFTTANPLRSSHTIAPLHFLFWIVCYFAGAARSPFLNPHIIHTILRIVFLSVFL